MTAEAAVTRSDRFSEISAGFDARHWRLLGVLASERRLAVAALEKLISADSAEREAFGLRAFIDASVRAGLFVDAGTAYTLVSTRSPGAERAFAIAPGFRPFILRRLADEGALERVRDEARALVGEGSLAELMTALYAGDEARLGPAVSGLKGRFPNGEELTFARNLLREAVCAPFDADSFARTWRDTGAALRVAEQVLSDALLELDPVEGLYAWTVTRLPSDAGPRLVRVVCEHALLRGDVRTVTELAKRLPTAEQLSFDAAARYVMGDLLSARSLLADAVAFRDKNKTTAAYTANAAPLLALIALVEEHETGAELARRLVRSPVESAPPLSGFAATSPLTSAARALRTLLRALKQPDSLEPQPSAHQLGVHAGAWETLILALSVHLHSDAAIGRAAWARRLSLAGKRWLEADYAWLGRQAQWLCQALDRGATGEFAGAPPRGAELALADLLQTRPEWRKSLDALLAFSEQAAKVEKAAVSERVAWFVDMVTGELTRPVLEEFRSESGWTRGRRVELSELWEVQATLPPEDRALLQHTELRAGRRVFKSDAREALCGHPRVFNGARGRLPVEVVRGTCRVEVRRERGHLLVEVEPRGALEGVNVVVESESRLLVYRVSEQLAKLFRVLPVGLRVPESHQAEALEVLARLAEHVEVRSAELDAHRAVPADSTPCLRISPETGAFWVELGVRPFGAQGRFFPPGFGRVKVSIYQGGDLLDTERDLDEERARCEALLERCPTLRAARASGLDEGEGGSDTPFSFGMGEEALLDLLLELRESELDCELEWKNGRPLTARGRLGVGSLKGALRRIKGWYIVKGEVALDAVTSVALGSLVEQPFTKTGRFLRLPSGDFVAVEERVRHAISVLRAHSERKGPTAAELRVPDAAFAAIQSLTAADTGFEIDASVSEWHARVESALGRDYPLPEALLATLRPYQIEGYEWLCRSSELGLGVCLADDMGLGKTIQILGLLLTRRAAGPALVVAPTSVCSNWLDEIARFAPSLVAVEYSGKQRGALLARFQPPSAEPVPDVLIVSYALLQQDSESLSAIEWNTAILDEAQFIKNAQSLRAKAAFGLNARYRVAMTGTPVENHLGDLFSIFRFLNESLLGSWKNFQLLYMRPIERDSDSGQREALKRLIQPFMLRRTKDQVLRELPPITTLRHEVRLSEDEALRYGLLRRQIHEKLRTVTGKREHKLRVFAEITRLRRFCCHPRLVFPDASHECSKLQTFLELVDELSENGHRALVFSQFVDFLELVREQLDERGIRYLYLDGSTPKAARGARVAAFQAGEAPLFLVSLKAGGFGVNLTAADYVIHLDPWWNPAVEAQATDRAHRIGQTRPVTVYRLITKDTIEEQIVDLHREKRALADALLEGTDVASKLDIDELRALLGPELG